MFSFNYEFARKEDTLHFKITGFTSYNKIVPVKNSIINEIKSMDDKRQPYKILFDLRGLKALDPRTVASIEELDKIIYESSVTKVGLVMDSIIAKLQQIRVANEYPMENVKLFISYDECLAWLKE